MNIKYLFAVSLAMTSVAVYGQTTPTIITTKGDKASVSDLKVEPWRVQNSGNQATLNTQSIYQNGRVGVGNFEASNINSQLEILGGGVDQLGIAGNLTGTKWSLFTQNEGLFFGQRRPNSRTQVGFFNTGNVAFGADISNVSSDAVGFFYDNATKRVKIGGNASAPTQALDVEGNVRIRNLTDANTQALQLAYNRDIKADANGNLGYVENRSTEASWNFIDFKTAVMPSPVNTTQSGTFRVSLGLSVEVTVPPQTQAQFKIDYSSGAMATQASAGVSYLGFTMYKRVNGVTNELDMGSRKFTFPGSFKGAGVTALGMPISGFAVDEVSNSTNTPITIVYDVQGYAENNNGSEIRFGMWQASGNNYNWGKGMMSVQTFFKPLN